MALPHNIIQLTNDALLNAFWRKKALAQFCQKHKISRTAISRLFLPDESKRTFLDYIFEKLIIQKNDIGHKIIFNMAQDLATFSDFPDLKNWKDSDFKIKKAQDSINSLKKALHCYEKKYNIKEKESKERKRQYKIETRRKEAEAKRNSFIKNKQKLEILKNDLNSLFKELGTQKAGYLFEDWFYDFVNHFEIECRRPYKSQGRQIDGALTIEGTTFLVELKFTQNSTQSPEIDTFLNIVNSKAENTMGVFFSISGYTGNAIVTASGKRTPLLLFDYNHIIMVLDSRITLQELISRVKRHASQTSESYLTAHMI